MATDATDPTAVIEQKTHGELLSFAFSRGKSRAHQSVKTLTEQTSHEYGDRFLIELIQNAYDAHHRDEVNGRIRIRLNGDEGKYGVLYVSNDGEPFCPKNFEAICDIGLSSKPPGESIGNKGLGFRSVLQICKWPEVYSAAQPYGSRTRFDGYCFGFARPDDIRRLCGDAFPNEQDIADQVIAEVSPYTLPIPLRDQSEFVQELAREGFVSVVRLPLSSESARQAVEHQVEDLRSSTAPLMLFLSRIRTLTVEMKQQETIEPFELSRSCTPLPGHEEWRDLRLELADLGDCGKYLIGTRAIPRELLMAAINKSVEDARLPSSWANWRGDAEVAVATRIDGPSVGSRLYNFLPMGAAATSPFAGFLNAPFYAKTDRTALHEDVALNSFLLRFGAEVCMRCIFLLRELGDESARCAIVDFLTWTSHHDLLSTAFAEADRPLPEALIIPIERSAVGQEYGSLNTVYRWSDEDYSFMTTKRLVKSAGALILDSRISEKQAERLDVFSNLVIGADLNPSTDTAAAWAEALAVALHKTQWKASQWDSLYEDLSLFFRDCGEKLV